MTENTSTHTPRYWGWKVVRLLVAFTLAALLLGLFYDVAKTTAEEVGSWALQRLPSDSSVVSQDQPEQVAPSPESPPPDTLRLSQRILTLDVTRRVIVATYEVQAGRDQALFKKAVREFATKLDDDFQATLDRFVEHTLGSVKIDAVPVQFIFLDYEWERGGPEGRIRLVSDSLRYNDTAVVRFVKPAPQDKKTVIIVESSEVRVNRGNVGVLSTRIPVSQSPARVVFEDKFPFQLKIHRPGRPATEAESPDLSALITGIDQKKLFFGPLLLLLFLGLPFLLLLHALRHEQLAEKKDRDAFFRIALLFLGWYVGYAAYYFLHDQLFREGGLPAAWRSMLKQPQEGIEAMVIVFVIWLWPWWVKRLGQVGKPSPASPQIPLGPVFRRLRLLDPWKEVLLGSLASVGIVLLVLQDKGVLTVGSGLGLRYIIGFIALIAACLWIIYEFFGSRRAGVSALVLTGALMACMVLLTKQVALRGMRFEVFLLMLLLLPFVLANARLIIPVATGRQFVAWWKSVSWMVRLVFVGGLFLFVHAGMLVYANGNYSVATSLLSMGLLGSRLWVFVLLVILLQLLHSLGKDEDRSASLQAAQEVGIVLALVFFYLPTEQLLYVPIVYLLGYVLLRKWALINPAFDPDASENLSSTVIRRLIYLKEGERALRVLKKEKLALLGQGDIDLGEYESSIDAFEKNVESKRADLLAGHELAQGQFLAAGAVAYPWQRAKTGAMYGFLLALPWLALYVYNLRTSAAPGGWSGWLLVLVLSALFIAQWPLRGFFLGYFYPYLRGANGMQKGFTLFLINFLPPVVATILINPPAVAAFFSADTSSLWLGFWFWGLQLFVHCLLLGMLSGDYEVLRRAELGWRHLVDVHNLGPLLAWGSSLVAAVGAAIITALADPKVIKAAINAFLPEVALPEG